MIGYGKQGRVFDTRKCFFQDVKVVNMFSIKPSCKNRYNQTV